jgi:Amt family ammonium transporter
MASVIIQAWWIFCATLVFLMIFGFLLLETGSVERRHVAGIAIKNVCMLFASSLVYGLFGYELMFGESIGGFCGNPLTLPAEYNVPAYRLYQTGFASVAATILSGAIAGRTTLVSNVVGAAIVAGLIYPIHAHWVWHRNGFLHDGNSSQLNVHDFAGGGTVHFVGGVAALIWCIYCGRLKSRRHDMPHAERKGYLSAAGVLILLIGWMGFNGGSAVGVSDSHDDLKAAFMRIASCIQFTVHAGGSGALAGFLANAFASRVTAPGRYLFSPTSVLTGAMGGLVAITATCDLTGPVLSALIGFAGGAVAVALAWLIAMKFDDPVAAIAVHAGGGASGMVAAGLINNRYLLGQIVDLLCAAAFTALVMAMAYGLFNLLKSVARIDLFLADEHEQEVGLKYSVDDESLDGSSSQTEAQRDYQRFNAGVFIVTLLTAAIILVGAILAGPAETGNKIVAVCTVIALFPTAVFIWRWLPRFLAILTGRTHTASSRLARADTPTSTGIAEAAPEVVQQSER